jgi:HSP20 family protein
MDVFDTAEGTVIRLEVAGMEIEDIDISLEQERMMIRGNRKNQQEIDATPRCYRQMEIKYADFQREVLLAMPVERDQIQATYRNGFLDIRVPLQKEAPR